jgi:hypothetical protein
MSKLNLLVHLNAYKDKTDTNDPALNHFKWTRDLQQLSVSEPESKCITLPAGQSASLFSGSVAISADATTTWDIALKTNSSNVYVISSDGGTAPEFRTGRSTSADATTEVTVTKNAKLMTLTSTGGTLFSLIAGGVVVGDELRLGSSFNINNQGKFRILAVSATSVTVENEIGLAEGPIVLGASFADQVKIYSQDGVQIGDKIDLQAGFSSASFGTYEVVDVADTYLEVFSNDSLPAESGVSNSPDAFLIYRDAKQFIFIESDKKLDITLNGALTNEIVPLSAGTALKPGFFMSSASLKSASVTNKSQETATIFYVTAE